MMIEVMSSYLPGRREDASCRASQGGILGIVLPLVHSALLGSCTKVTESQFNHYALVNTVLFKKQKGKLYRQTNTEPRCLETLQELEVVRRFLRQQHTKYTHPPPLVYLHCFHVLFPHPKWELLTLRSCEPLGSGPIHHHFLRTEKISHKLGLHLFNLYRKLNASFLQS